ncbi:NAD-dependent epimerase/dehydratase family protein [Micromonospora siamensis]|uniref:Nucleoside-diphosphate-sugar epimerase n=1 Tax=Micromonospora siamensis TaxID=299152 RepID=A0A1C5I9V9_9ACTN|nr:NAD(P)-dependent oxidoreductase [Micromonospora siamensis]SCG54893.1 Nucleoside-diphosphate-sugar epimerase [Micromonospora siamensis]
MTRVAVTGGSGKLGRAVVDELLDHGYEVVNLDLAPPAQPRCPFTRIDLGDYGQVLEALTGIDSRYDHVDAVVHLAAVPGPGVTGNAATFTHNITATHHVFAAARAAGIHNVVWASSETLLGLPFDESPPPYVPVDEEYPARPETSYALAKHLEEQMVAQFCRWEPRLKAIGLRFSNVMEPADYADFPGYDADPRLRAWNMWGYIDARDGAQAVRRALEHQATGMDVFVIANADTVMSRPSGELVAEYFPDVPVRRAVTGTGTLLSIDKARRVLGYEPRHGWRNG